MRRFALGDPHGAYKALRQVFQESRFDYDEDELIVLGDTADGWPEVPECFHELLKIKKLIYVLGNHDEWLLDWFKTGATPVSWTSQGGQATINAYNRHTELDKIDWKKHRDLLINAKYYHVTPDNKCFVHGGFEWKLPIKDQDKDTLLWDRRLFQIACMWDQWKSKGVIAKEFDEVFVGHTTTSWSHPNLKPVHVSNVWNLDQGAGWEGILTLMDIDSKEYWQSDIVKTLYPYDKRR